jgi:hypothetical protein
LTVLALLLSFTSSLAVVSSWKHAPPASPTIIWTDSEHRQLADSALTQALSLIGHRGSVFVTPFGLPVDETTPIVAGQSFTELCVAFAAEDGRKDRFQMARKTVLQQLDGLESTEIDELWRLRRDADLQVIVPGSEGVPENAVAMYIAHHLMALRFANVAAQEGAAGESDFRMMLAYEAVAQGYLHDALSAGHLLVPRHGLMPPIHSVNSRVAHDRYSTDGVFVMNGMGQVYEAFGDGVLTYYGSSFRAALDAARASIASVFFVYLFKLGAAPIPKALEDEIRLHTGSVSLDEVVAGWLASRNGSEYYLDAKLPGLLRLPTPIAATWSVRTDDTGGRRHYHQLSETGFYDPDLPEELRRQLHSKEVVGRRVNFGFMGSDEEIRAAIDTVDTLSSVEFVQNMRIQPSYQGVILAVAVGPSLRAGEWGAGLSASLGFGLEQMALLQDPSIQFGSTFFTNGKSPLIKGSVGANTPALPLRLELGVAAETDSLTESVGLSLGAAIDLFTFDAGFTYIGGQVRLRYEAKYFRTNVHLFSLEVALH